MIKWYTLSHKEQSQIFWTELLQRHIFHDHKSLGSSKGIHYLDPMKYHGASIENINYHD